MSHINIIAPKRIRNMFSKAVEAAIKGAEGQLPHSLHGAAIDTKMPFSAPNTPYQRIAGECVPSIHAENNVLNISARYKQRLKEPNLVRCQDYNY